MHQEQFPIPQLPSLEFRGISLQALNSNMPDYVSTARWHARLVISLAFLVFSSLTSVVCYYFGLVEDIFFVATLSLTLLLYLMTMPMLTRSFVESPRIQEKVKTNRQQYYLKALSITPLENRAIVSTKIWDALRSDEWMGCISYANTLDRARTVHCCQQIGKIASDLTSNDSDRFCDAMLKVMNNQRGSVRYFFDILIMLGEQQFQDEHEENKKVRSTQKLMLDDIFMHR
ncbi:hypothetical protein [Enterovibrio nigricans]|uniref:Uncharacterized protein n=1 Tax=Enterovibrio nigricans DSM 22720 TaxID=1121868 RepID=A0A1T4VCY8_9GAMM|nr:hypothetical protein [Enterovibrio nigricans]PKF49262.1 hypothetical protein AT251_20175 [Enterovibrio nigricans]SKA62810.1 hypothetical protein SAMN02745132_03672 [Enterovibrio nigricans DSM 22720]